MHRDVHRIVVPTLWGYATVVRTRDIPHSMGPRTSSPDESAHLVHGGTRRIDTVLPPNLSADELLNYHAQLLQRPAHRRRPRTAAAAVGRCDVLRHAIDVRTTTALTLHLACAAPTPRDVVFTGLVRAMRRADHAHLSMPQEGLARQLVWCALHAARDHQLAQVLDATHALRHLATNQHAGTTITDAFDQA
jgi:hypothetical protein